MHVRVYITRFARRPKKAVLSSFFELKSSFAFAEIIEKKTAQNCFLAKQKLLKTAFVLESRERC